MPRKKPYYAGLNFYGNFGENEMLGNWPSVPGKNLQWVRPEMAVRENQPYEMEIYVDDTLRWLKEIDRVGYPGSSWHDEVKYKICVQVEPKQLLESGRFKHGNTPTNYDLIENPEVYENYFDLIFTTYPHYMDIHPKFRYYEGGLRSYIPPKQQKIHKKTNGICCIMSNKDYMPGHLLRHDIRNKMKKWNFSTPKWGLNHSATDLLSQPIIAYNSPPEKEKHLGTKDYMFELVIENEQGPFFSEKLIDAMLVGCIPVYWSRGKHDVSLEVFDRNEIITFEEVEELYEMLRNQQDHFNVDVYTSKMKAIKNNFKVAKIYSSMGDTLWKCGLEEFVKGTK